MSPINPAILDTAKTVADRVLRNDNDPKDIYPVPVGARYLYLSADRSNIIGPDAVEIRGTVFYLGFRRQDFS